MRAITEPAAPARPRSRTLRRRAVAACAATLLLAPLAAAAPTAATSRPPANPAVVSEWNAIAAATLPGAADSFLYLAFMNAAVYNAVVGIEGRYEPYRFHGHAPRWASSQAAAAAAAHKVLVTYAPSAQVALDTAYAASLAQVPDGWAKTRGVRFGERAADVMIAQRADDGRNASVAFTTPLAPGVWRPTPTPAPTTPPSTVFPPYAFTWLGSVTPMLVHSGAQFDPGPPPALTSAQYTADFNEVKALGSATSATRSAAQTATARFFSGNPVVQFTTALRDQATVRHLDIVDSARMFAAVDASLADAVISVFYSKFKYGLWRPITAINLADTDGNPSTVADPAWVSLIPSPAYPDYVSGYNGVMGAFTQALEDVFDTPHLALTLTTTATTPAVPPATVPTPIPPRSYDSGAALRQEVIDARVWLGIHFRFADTAGAQMGVQVADWGLDRNFGPVDDDDDRDGDWGDHDGDSDEDHDDGDHDDGDHDDGDHDDGDHDDGDHDD